MAFQMRDETAGINIMYVDNADQMGLGSLPNSGQRITVQGISLVNTSGNFGCSVMPPGAAAPYEGSITVPANGSASVAISAHDLPSVTSTNAPAFSSSSFVEFTNPAGTSITINYSIF